MQECTKFQCRIIFVEQLHRSLKTTIFVIRI